VLGVKGRNIMGYTFMFFLSASLLILALVTVLVSKSRRDGESLPRCAGARRVLDRKWEKDDMAIFG
jgi:hypothetical protein